MAAELEIDLRVLARSRRAGSRTLLHNEGDSFFEMRAQSKSTHNVFPGRTATTVCRQGVVDDLSKHPQVVQNSNTRRPPARWSDFVL